MHHTNIIQKCQKSQTIKWFKAQLITPYKVVISQAIWIFYYGFSAREPIMGLIISSRFDVYDFKEDEVKRVKHFFQEGF